MTLDNDVSTLLVGCRAMHSDCKKSLLQIIARSLLYGTGLSGRNFKHRRIMGASHWSKVGAGHAQCSLASSTGVLSWKQFFWESLRTTKFWRSVPISN